MKYIIAIIQPDRLDEVIAELEEEEIILITVSDVMGRGRQKGVAEVYRSHVEKNKSAAQDQGRSRGERREAMAVRRRHHPRRAHRQHR